MSFSNELENEINLYLKNLEELKQIDMPMVIQALNNYADPLLVDRQNKQKQLNYYKQQISNCENINKKIIERNNEISVFVRNEGKGCLKKQIDIPEHIKAIQKEIDRLQEEVNSIKGIENVNFGGKKDYEATRILIDILNKNIERLNGEIDALNNESIFGQSNPDKYFDILLNYKGILNYVVVSIMDTYDYGNLMAVLQLAIKGMPFSIQCNGYLNNGKYSVDCLNLYNKITSDNDFSDNKNEAFFNEINDSDKIVYDADGIYIAAENDYRYEKRILSAEFLKELLMLIKQNENANLPTLAIAISKKYCNDRGMLGYLEAFKDLYEETPEQIMVRDNKYYEEQRLRELEYQAEQDRKQREREAEREERWREEQLEIQRENARAEQRRWEEDNRRADEQRKRDAEEERIRQRQQQREERDRMSSELKAKNEAIRRCNRCANHDACGRSRGVINCGAFRPKY